MRKCRKYTQSLIVEKIQNTSADKLFDVEPYVFVHSSEFGNIYESQINEVIGQNKSKKVSELNGYVEVCYSGKRVVRKCRGANVGAGKIQMGYRTCCELGLDQKNVQQVCVRPICWFLYYWRNSDAGIKGPFVFAFVGLFLSVLLAIIGWVLGLLK